MDSHVFVICGWFVVGVFSGECVGEARSGEVVEEDDTTHTASRAEHWQFI